MTAPEDVTSKSLAATIAHGKWVQARAQLIRDYAISETANQAATEVAKLLLSPLTPKEIIEALSTWVKVTRENAVIPE